MRTLRLLFALSLPALLAFACTKESKVTVEPTKHPFLWRIETEPVSWLFGTIHLPDRRVTTLRDSVTNALAAADVLITELDLGEEARAQARAGSLLPDNTTLKDVLPPDLYARLGAYLASKRFPLENAVRLKPWMVMTILPQLDDLRAAMTETALDAMLVRDAKALGKQTASLESWGEQFAVFDSFSYEEQGVMLDATLAVMEKANAAGRKLLEEMVQAYLAGDLDGLQAFVEALAGMEEHADLEARLEKLILTDRNERMVERLVSKLRTEPKRSFFVAVGALHYLGETGIVAGLRRAGFVVQRIAAPPPPLGGDKARSGARASHPGGAREPVGAGRGR